MSKKIALNRWRGISSLWSDSVIAVLIFAFAAFWGAKFVESGKIPPQFYQGEFAPAVLEACGKGFVVPRRLVDIPGLEDFLQLKKATFSCDQIPSEFEQTGLNKLQESSRYLMGLVSLNWRLTEVSWNALLPLYALFFGLSSVAVYGVFRLGMRKPLAAFLAILFLLSPLQLNNLPHLRDYAKAPFIIAIVLLLGLLVKYPFKPIKTVMIGLIAGAVLGTGIGFRMDLLIFIPAVLITLTAFTPSGFAKDMKVRLVAMSAFAIAFIALGWPILTSMSGGGNTFHVILLGLFSPFDQPLNIQHAEVYEWGYWYNDAYLSQFLNSYAHRQWETSLPMQLSAPAYEQAGMAYYVEILKHFPSDIVTRILASAWKLAQFTGYESHSPWIGKISLFLLLMSIFIIVSVNLRWVIFLTITIIFLLGYPSLQFAERHYFPLQFVSLFFIGFFLQQLLVIRNKLPIRFSETAAKNVWWFSFLLLILSGLYFGLRMYQEVGLRNLLIKYQQLPFSNRKISVFKNSDDTVQLRPFLESDSLGQDTFPLRTEYWGLEIDGDKCQQSQLNVRIRFRYSDPYYDASRFITIDMKTPVRYLFHTYSSIGSQYGAYSGISEFDGIEVTEEDFACIKNFGELDGFEQMPLLMNLTFREGWEKSALYQTIGRDSLNNKMRRSGVTLFSFPETLAVTKKQADELLSHITKSYVRVSIIDTQITATDGVFEFNGETPSAYAYAMQLSEEKSSGESYLVAEGELYEGGITLGLLKDSQWSGQTNITTPGKFKIVMKPDAGDYTAMLAHNVPNEKFNHFKLTKLGWVRASKIGKDVKNVKARNSASSEMPVAK